MKRLVFIVDDSDIFLDLISNRLAKKHGCTIKGFGDGESMLDALEDNTPDIIILDHYLDQHDKNAMTGMEVLSSIVEKNGTEVPIIMITGAMNAALLNSLKEKGIFDLISKNDEDFIENLDESIIKAMEFIAD